MRPVLRQDARTFTRAANSRQHLLSRLGNLPGRSVLPAAMLHDLADAWQASAEVDTDLARWANGAGCPAAARAAVTVKAREGFSKKLFYFHMNRSRVGAWTESPFRGVRAASSTDPGI